jgi:hypothetical protein
VICPVHCGVSRQIKSNWRGFNKLHVRIDASLGFPIEGKLARYPTSGWMGRPDRKSFGLYMVGSVSGILSKTGFQHERDFNHISGLPCGPHPHYGGASSLRANGSRPPYICGGAAPRGCSRPVKGSGIAKYPSRPLRLTG